jgi:hypothetical protein
MDSWLSLVDAGLIKLSSSGSLAQLLVISLSKCIGITSSGVNCVFRGALILKKANFSGCHQVWISVCVCVMMIEVFQLF